MKLIAIILALIALSRAGQIYHGTTQAEYVQSDYQPQQIHQDQSHLLTENYQVRQQNRAEGNARILRHEFDKADHGYQYVYETENGIRAEETGQSQGNGHSVQGAYSYTGDDGQVYTVTYTADETGFHAQGAHLPTPPPVPEAIVRSLEKNAQDAANGVFDDGAYKEDPRQYNQQQQQIQIPQEQYSQHYSQEHYQHIPSGAGVSHQSAPEQYVTTDSDHLQNSAYHTIAPSAPSGHYQASAPSAPSGHYQASAPSAPSGQYHASGPSASSGHL